MGIEKLSNGLAPLYIASQNGHVDVVQLLATARANLEQRCRGMLLLRIASQLGHARVVQLLLSAGVYLVDSPICTGQKEVGGKQFNCEETPLYIAAKEGHAEVVQVLIGAGADRDKRPSFAPMGTPLYIAAKNGRTEVVRLLIDSGADINRTEPCVAAINKGESIGTPLCIAVKNNHYGVVKLLLEAGADATIKSYGRKPIESARMLRHKEVELLLEQHQSKCCVM